MDSKRSKLGAIRLLKNWSLRLTDESSNLDRVRAEVSRVEQEITRARDAMAKADSRRTESLTSRESLARDIETFMREERSLHDIISRKVVGVIAQYFF